MRSEKRRYFRIDETIGLTYEILDSKACLTEETVDVLDLMSGQDEKIESLLTEVELESPKVAELIRAFNQKLERVVGQIAMESRMVDRLANRVQEVNISACGIGFVCDDDIDVGAQLRIELQLFPAKKTIVSTGIVVGCEPLKEDYYWRIDFYGMSHDTQELLIQHIVQRQSVQLKMKT